MQTIADLLKPATSAPVIPKHCRVITIEPARSRKGEAKPARIRRDAYLDLFDSPVAQLDAGTAADKFGVDPETARRHLNNLVKCGALTARRGWWKSAPVYYKRRKLA